MISSCTSSDIHSFTSDSSWYLAASKPRQEMRAVENLLNQSIKAFTPTIQVEKIRAGKRKIEEEALFTGYVFISLTPEDGLWHKVRSTRGVRDWVRFSGMPAKIPPQLVDRFIAQQTDSEEAVIKRCFNAGDAVCILSGPFKGLKGIYESSSGEERALILIEFLGKINRLKLTNDQIAAD
ncbi:transcription/translation regulatory transformer protein RfaH [Aliikangiella sp. IMCC44359]|uniref:transcription/translation regulatory transformer protein RfaH n=1 Tax=Aliikangiella sp. IMCC44359 TaxID=3459125 RepID=UPI00403B19C8